VISASALLVVVAFVTLIVGIFQSGLGLIWVSIASSVLAAIFLGLGVAGSKRPVPASGPSDMEEAGVTTAVRERVRLAPEAEEEPREHVRITPAEREEEEAERPIALEPTPTRGRARSAASRTRERARPTATRTGASRARGRAAAAPKAAAPKAAAPKAAAPKAAAEVVVIPDRDKFHKQGCRYAKGPGAMSLTKAQARRQGYKACGVCKP
jgi:hypothetical protein